MKVVLVYDSVFGNTESLAKHMAHTVPQGSSCEVVRCKDLTNTQLEQADLVIAASPTRAFNATPELKARLQELPPGSLKGKKIASWDTRVDVAQVNSKVLHVMVKLFGYAAPKLEKQLLSKGGTLAVPCEGFFVKDKEGPVAEGEMDRAAQWIQRAVEADG